MILSLLALAFNLYEPLFVVIDLLLDIGIAAILLVDVELVQDVLVICRELAFLNGHVILHNHLEDRLLGRVLLGCTRLAYGRDRRG